VIYISQIPVCLCLCVCVCVCVFVWAFCVQKASVHGISVYAGVFTDNMQSERCLFFYFMKVLLLNEYLGNLANLLLTFSFFIYVIIPVYIYFYCGSV